MPKIITFDQLRDYGILLGRRAIARAEDKGTFPRRVQISEARIGWLEEEIKEYVARKIRERK